MTMGEGRAAAIVCSVEGCGFAITTEGTEHWAETIGISVRGVQCSDHPDAPMVQGWIDSEEAWR